MIRPPSLSEELGLKKPLAIGIIGAGGISEAHAAGYLRVPREARVVAVADVVKKTAVRKARKWHAEAWYLDYKELLRRGDIDAVSVCTPNSTHAEISVAAMDEGKHVLCEKPIAVNLEQADQMIEAADKNRVILQIGHHNRFDPIFEMSKGMIDRGLLGKVCMVKARQAHGWGWAKWKPKGWFTQPEWAGGGTLLDNGCHLFDLLRWLVGDVESVSAYVGAVYHDVKVEDNGIALLRFENGALGEVDASWTYRGDQFENYVHIFGSSGTILASSSPRRLQVHSEKLRSGRGLRGWIAPFTPPGEPHIAQVRDFVTCILKGGRPRVSGEDGRRALELVLAAYLSSKTGRSMKLPISYGKA